MVNKPHGGVIVNRVLTGRAREKILEDLKHFDKLNIDQLEYYDLLNICYGVYTPLEGFMTYDNIFSVLKEIRLEDGTLWSIPIILDSDRKLPEGEEVILYYNKEPVGLLSIEESFKFDFKGEFVDKLFKTRDLEHPGVYYYRNMKEYLVAGKVHLLKDIDKKERYITPLDTRRIFREKGWKNIVAFQTRNVPHKGHEFLVKYSLYIVDGAFINPVIGKKKKGDWKDELIEEAWETLFRLYFPKNKTFLGFLRYVMRYAGPREALHHAIMRKNLGATHFIIGRDHAGVKDYYKPYEAQEFVKQFEEDLDMKILGFRELYWCDMCNAIVSDDICPHDDYYKIRFSGTLIRKMVLNGEQPDEKIFRKEILDVIRKYKNPFVE